jgi:hypothetical protein
MSDDWKDEYLTLIEDCEKRESKLTDWERTFLGSIESQIGREKPLSVKQTETLDRIWERVTRNG